MGCLLINNNKKKITKPSFDWFSPRISSTAAGEPLISGGERSMVVGWVGAGRGWRGCKQRGNQIRLYKGVSHSCLVETLHLAAPLQVNNRGPGVCQCTLHPHIHTPPPLHPRIYMGGFAVEHLNTHSVGVGAVTRPPKMRVRNAHSQLGRRNCSRCATAARLTFL